MPRSLPSVANIDANRRNGLDADVASLVLVEDALLGLGQALEGQFATEDELNQALCLLPES